MRLASLPWYDLHEVQPAHDALWAALADRLRAMGVDGVPDGLERRMDPQAQWRSPALLLGQACGYDVATWQAASLRVVAAPCFEVEGCAGPTYRSFVVVHRSSGASTLADLRGARCVINGWTSHSGMNGLRLLLPTGARLASFFARVLVSGAHERSVEMVASGEADVASIDCVTYSLLARHRPGALEALRVLTATAPALAPPFVTSASTPPAEVEALGRALREVTADPSAWATLRLAGVANVRPGAYAAMRPARVSRSVVPGARS